MPPRTDCLHPSPYQLPITNTYLPSNHPERQTPRESERETETDTLAHLLRKEGEHTHVKILLRFKKPSTKLAGDDGPNTKHDHSPPLATCPSILSHPLPSQPKSPSPDRQTDRQAVLHPTGPAGDLLLTFLQHGQHPNITRPTSSCSSGAARHKRPNLHCPDPRRRSMEPEQDKQDS
jgi:hypothetical protein